MTPNNTLTGILIDPIKRSVRRVEVPQQEDGYYNKRIAELLGCALIERAVVTRDPNGGGVDLWIDEEGLLVQPNERGYFRFQPFGEYVFAGRGLLLGYDARGNTTSAPPVVSVTAVYGMVEPVAFDSLDPEGETLNPKWSVTTWSDGASETTHYDAPVTRKE